MAEDLHYLPNANPNLYTVILEWDGGTASYGHKYYPVIGWIVSGKRYEIGIGFPILPVIGAIHDDTDAWVYVDRATGLCWDYEGVAYDSAEAFAEHMTRLMRLEKGQ